MLFRSRSRFGLGVVLALAAIAVQVPLTVLLSYDSYQLFLTAVGVSAIRGGKSSGAAALGISLFARIGLMLVRGHHEAAVLVADRMVTFILMGAALCWMGGALQESWQREKELVERSRLLSGLLPICAGCKRIRDDRGRWCQIESYISAHSDAEFSHGFCPKCAAQWSETTA
jgi:hypothetical protein